MDSSDYFNQNDKSKQASNGKLFDNQSLNDSLSSLYNPPYSSGSQGTINRKKQGYQEPLSGHNNNNYLNDALSQPSDYSKKLKALQEKNQTAPAPSIPVREEHVHYVYEPPQAQEIAIERPIRERASDDIKSGYITILALSLGVNLAILGLLQLCFSTNGKLILEWDTEYWFFYLIPAAAFLFLGLRKLSAFKDQ